MMAVGRVFWSSVITLSLCLIILSQLKLDTIYYINADSTQPMNVLGNRLYVSQELIRPHVNGFNKHTRVKSTA